MKGKTARPDFNSATHARRAAGRAERAAPLAAPLAASLAASLASSLASRPASSRAVSSSPSHARSSVLPRATGRATLARFVLLLTVTLSPFPFSPSRYARAQETVDRMVATINGRELITYTDLLWQLALQPDTPLENPRPQDLRNALDLLVDQRLVAQEAGRLPAITAKPEDVNARVAELIKRFPSREAFYQRIARVGLTGEQLNEIVRQRIEIERYLDFRFRSFVVVTQEEVAAYYRDVYVPRWRRQQPGRIVPALPEAAKAVEAELREAKIESDTDAFLEQARARAEIVFLEPVIR